MKNPYLDDEAQETTNRFQDIYYNTRIDGVRIWERTHWMGYPVLKTPMDLWMYQEILHEVKPDLIVETGTFASGSALYLAHLLDIIGKGEVVSIDIQEQPIRARHPRISYVLGSSADPSVIDSVFSGRPAKQTTLVILDSDHSKEHVLREIHALWHRVSVGSYLIVEDSNINGHPVYPSFGPGPYEAVEEFLARNDCFQVDGTREKFLLTWNPRGYLKRVK